MIMTMIATVMMITSVSANHVPTFGNQRDNTPVALPITQNTRPVENGMPQQNNDKKDLKKCNKQNNKNSKDCKKNDCSCKKDKKNDSKKQVNTSNSKKTNKTFGNMKR